MDPEIVIIGAGAAGLMAARELGKSGKKVLVLEARDRIGGRIMPINEGFDYPAEGGAEWIHGDAPITKGLIKEAGLTLIREAGDVWNARSGDFTVHKSFIDGNLELKERLAQLKEDVSISDFLDKNFDSSKYKDLKNSIVKIVEGYDAADPDLISTLTLRSEWLGVKSSLVEIDEDHRIKQGYGALMDFLRNECEKHGVEIRLSNLVKSIEMVASGVLINESMKAEKVIVTVPISVLKDIDFKNEELKNKIAYADKIGFGNVIKFLVKFKTRWWEDVKGKDLSKMAFILCNEKFLTWWSQYPETQNTLTGWMAGPEAAKHKDCSDEELFEIAITSLSNAINISKEDIKNELISYKVINWVNDPFTRGAYSYDRFDTGDVYEKLAEPYQNAVYLAGEALYSGEATATVEGALGSGLETARKIINNK